MTLSSEFKNHPFLTGEEFTEVCHYLDRRYCQASLGPLRKQWKLRICTALNVAFALGPEYNTYIQITCPLEDELDDEGLSSCLENFSLGSSRKDAMETETDGEMIAAEEADEV